MWRREAAHLLRCRWGLGLVARLGVEAQKWMPSLRAMMDTRQRTRPCEDDSADHGETEQQRAHRRLCSFCAAFEIARYVILRCV